MKKGLSIGIVIIVLLAIFGINTYNGLVKKQEEVNGKFADISVQLERRADLIPNLVNVVKGYAAHETKIIESITTSREKLLQANTVGEKARANDELSNAIHNLLVIVENYPNLKADTNFVNLQDELAGTENRIAIARKEYNEAVKEFNKEIKVFPTNLFARIFNFKELEYFEAKETSNEVPNVSFE